MVAFLAAPVRVRARADFLRDKGNESAARRMVEPSQYVFMNEQLKSSSQTPTMAATLSYCRKDEALGALLLPCGARARAPFSGLIVVPPQSPAANAAQIELLTHRY